MVVGRDALHDRGDAFQTHAGVDVLAGQRPQIVGRIADAVELREHQVPNLDFFTVGRMKEDFAARAADAIGALARRRSGPEIVGLAHPRDPVGSELDVLLPDVGRFVVVEIDGHGQLVGRQGPATFCRSRTPRPS